MYKSGANTVYVNTWRFYPETYPYNNNRNFIGVSASIWLYGIDINGANFALNTSRRDSDTYPIDISRAVVTSITRRTNLANGQLMPDTWNNGTNTGYIYISAKNSSGESLLDANIEVTTDSAIYKAGQNSASHSPYLKSGGNAGDAYYVGTNEYFQPVYVIPVCNDVEGSPEVLYYYHSE